MEDYFDRFIAVAVFEGGDRGRARPTEEVSLKRSSDHYLKGATGDGRGPTEERSPGAQVTFR